MTTRNSTNGFGRFWAAVSNGLGVHELWTKLRSEAQAGYSVYSADVEAYAGHRDLPKGRYWRLLTTPPAFLWAVLMKLSPPRRVLLLLALLCLLLTPVRVIAAGTIFHGSRVHLYGDALLLILLFLEVADRVHLNRSLEIAREIQLWLVPRAAPEVPGLDAAFTNRPQHTVAGDYYDLFSRLDREGEKVLLVVADVAGKNVPAALLMATFQASLKTLCAGQASFPDLVDGLNRYCCAHSNGGLRFTTAFLAEYSPSSGEMVYINAGHPPPLLWDDAGTISRLEEGGMPFGISTDAGYVAGRRTLHPGNFLLIYTDGLVEARSPDGEEFGEGRLIAWLLSQTHSGNVRARDALHRLNRQVESFMGATVQHDDITCLLVRRTAGRSCVASAA